MKNFRKAIGLLLAACLAACSQQGMIDKFSTPQERQMALDAAAAFRTGNVDALTVPTEPELRAQIVPALAPLKAVLAVPGPFRIVTVQAATSLNGPTLKEFILVGGAGNRWAVANVTLRGSSAAMRLAGFHAFPANADPIAATSFEASRRGATGWLWLALMLASVATCITAVVLIWRGHWLDRRWPWTIGSLLGLGLFRLDWSTGAWDLQPIYFSLLGAQAMKAGPFAPWVLGFSIPVCAILVIVRWLRRDRDEVAPFT